MPDVSIIIPCYNQGHFIHETIQSVINQSHPDYECIIVNDGSTDPNTVSILKSINHPNIKVIHTQNQGLASARNNGIKIAQAEIILPLDSDDTIAPRYVEKALEIMNGNSAAGIVYGYTEWFGDKKGRYELPGYSLEKMMIRNLIPCCAFFRRADWEAVGGYNPNMIYGYEDWDFWISIIALGKKVIQIPEVCFYYRIRKESMASTMSLDQVAKMRGRIFLNHKEFYEKNIESFYGEINKIEQLAYGSLYDRMISEKLAHPLKTAGNIFSRVTGNK